MDTVRFRRVASAVSLVVGPALLLAATVALPWNNSDETAKSLELTAQNVNATQLGDLLIFLGILATIPAVLAVMRVLRGGAPLLGLIGGSLAVAGLVGGMLLVLSDQYNIGLSERTEARGEIVAALEGSSAWVINLVLVVFLLGIIVGGIILGAGLLRSRIVPAWAGWALIASSALSVAARPADAKALDVVASLLFLIGLAAVARVVWLASDRNWDRGELAPLTPRTGDAVVAA